MISIVSFFGERMNMQQCVALYSKLDKMDSLREEYVKNRPGEIHKAWFAFAPAVDTAAIESSSAVDSGFTTWLPSWYEKVLSLLTEERRQSSTVFGAEMAPEILVLVRQFIAERVELPLSAVHDGDRLLSDLHLNSITVSQIVSSALPAHKNDCGLLRNYQNGA